MKNLKVENIKNNGRNVNNQFIISYEENNKKYRIFQSYNSMILRWENDVLIEVGLDWNYSRTTGKYRNFLTDMNKKQFKKMLEENFEYRWQTGSYNRVK